MKPEVLNALLTARTLFDTARVQCFIRDRHVASAGLVVLQDAVELIFYACLLELGADEHKNIESLSFDQLIGELKSQDLKVIKSGTLKAMNKQRVLVKHYAQLAEPVAVQNFYEASLSATDSVLAQVIGKPLQQIVIADAISAPDLVNHINEASDSMESGEYFEAMVSIRKLLFLAIESEYDIRPWQGYEIGSNSPGPFLTGKTKAPQHTRHKKWIDENVNQPTDYVQLDPKSVRADMIELGIDPEELFNVLRLTPQVYPTKTNGWAVRRDPTHTVAADKHNARYCLDVVLAILMKQQLRQGIVRVVSPSTWKVRMLRDHPVLKRASASADKQGTLLRKGEVYYADAIVSALDGDGEFVQVYELQVDPVSFFDGFIPRDSCEIEDA